MSILNNEFSDVNLININNNNINTNVINSFNTLKIETPDPKIKKKYFLPKIKNKFTKKWFPNSTGRDIPMTSRFGIEHNKFNTFLISSPIKFPKLKSPIKFPKFK